MSSRFKNSSSFKIDNDNAFYFEAAREREWNELARTTVCCRCHCDEFYVARIRATMLVSADKKKRINALIYAFDVTTIIVLIELILK